VTGYADALHVADPGQPTVRLGPWLARVDTARNWVVLTRFQNGIPNTVGFSGDEITDAIAVLRTAADWFGQSGEAAPL
jgi:hypothetical protein